MKKSVFMRAAGVMLVMCLILSCAVFGTMAKYISDIEGSDTATVASWKINVGDQDIATVSDPLVFNLFSTVKDSNGSAETDVTTGDGVKLIAPGTSGSFAMEIENASQVNAKYTLELTESDGNAIPLQYSVDNSNWVDGIEELSMTELTDNALAMNAKETMTVYWRWAFEGGDDYHGGQTDLTDTGLGVDAQTDPATVTITAKIIAAQVD